MKHCAAIGPASDRAGSCNRQRLNLTTMRCGPWPNTMRPPHSHQTQPYGKGRRRRMRLCGSAGSLRTKASRQGIIACQSCHGPDRIAGVPVLSGQYRDYLFQQLRLFKAGVRGGSKAVIMTTVASRMSEQQMEDVASLLCISRAREGESPKHFLLAETIISIGQPGLAFLRRLNRGRRVLAPCFVPDRGSPRLHRRARCGRATRAAPRR